MVDVLKVTEMLQKYCHHVYFQPPESISMKYPAIVFNRRLIENTNANDTVYNQRTSFELTVIDPDPEGVIAYEISKLPYCTHNRHYTADNLNHDVFILFI